MSSNKEFFARKCNNEGDLGTHENDCPWDDNQYCLKLKIEFNLENRKKNEFLENSFRDSDILKLIPRNDRNKMWKELQKRKNLRFFIVEYKNRNTLYPFESIKIVI